MQASARAQLGIKWPKPRVQDGKWGEIAAMANARGQLWDNYGTTMGQLWDNYGTTYGTTHFLQVFVHFAIFGRKIKVFLFEDPKCARPKKIQGFEVVP